MSFAKKISKISVIVVLIAILVAIMTACFSSEAKITFKPNGGTEAEPIILTEEMESVTLPTPTRTGYIFDGWFKDRSFNEPVDSVLMGENIPTSSVTFYAKWTIQKIKITFKAGTTVVKTVEVDYGTVIEPDDFPSLENYPDYEWANQSFEATYNREFTALEKVKEEPVYSVSYFTVSKDEDGKDVYELYKKFVGVAGTVIETPKNPVDESEEGNRYFVYWYYLGTDGVKTECEELPTVIEKSHVSLYAEFATMGNDTGFLYYEEVSEGIVVTGFTQMGEYQASVSIPSKINGKDVIAVGKSGEPFKGKGIFGSDFLNTLIIPKTVMSIADWAFFDCNALEKVVFAGENIPIIGKGAFAGCKSLKQIEFPDYLTTIGEYAFAGITLKNGEETEKFGIMNEDGFSEYEWKITDMALSEPIFNEGSKLSNIGDYAFFNCKELKTITLSSVITAFNYRAFVDSGIENVLFHSGNSGSMLKGIDGAVLSKNGRILHYYALNANSEYTIPEGVVTVADYAFSGNKSITNVVFPASVTSIGIGTFENCTSLKNVNLSSSVVSIKDKAFYGCLELVEISLPETLDTLGEYAFAYCKNLSAVNFSGDKLTALNDYAFISCESLTSFIVPRDVMRIGEYTFANCVKMGMLAFNGSNVLLEIGSYAFANCVLLSSVTLPSSIEQIGDYAFAGLDGNRMNFEISDETTLNKVKRYGSYAFANTSITKFTFSGDIESNEAFGEYILYNCKSLKKASFTYSDNYDTVPEGLFYGCSSMVDITFTANIKNVEDYAFYGCSTMSIANFRTVEKIGISAFENCISLSDMSLPYTLYELGERAFYNCQSITNIVIPAKLKVLPKEAFAYCTSLGSMESIGVRGIAYEINSELGTLGENSFAYCTSLVTATLPQNLKLRDVNDTEGMVKNPFYGCESLRKFEFDRMADGEKTTNGLYTEDGVVYRAMFRKDSGEESDMEYAIYAYPTTKSRVDIEIGIYVSEIDRYAFYGSTVTGISFLLMSDQYGVESVMLISIGDYAFAESEIEIVEISYRVYKIGEFAFYKSKLKNLVIDAKNVFANDTAYDVLNRCSYGHDGENIVSDNALDIGAYSFANTSLPNITVPGRVISIGERAFANNYKLTDINFIADRALKIGNYAFENNNLVTTINLPATIYEIGDGAFYRCNNISSVKFAHTNDQVSIGAYAFAEIHYLYEIILPDNLVSIGDGVFEGNTRLKYVTFGNAATRVVGALELPAYIFYGVNKLETVTIPSYVSKIGDYAFLETEISEVTIEASGEALAIGNGTFKLMKNLKSIDLPNRVYAIGNEAFAESSLEEFIFDNNGSALTIGDRAFENTKIKEVNFNSRVTSIGIGAFANISTLVSFTAINGIKEIPDETFMNCLELTSVTVDDGVTSIGAYAFYNCTVTSFEARGVCYVGDNAFNLARAENVLIGGNNGTSDVILEEGAFENAVMMKDVKIISNGKLIIGEVAFKGCAQLVSLELTGAEIELATGFAVGASNLGEGFKIIETDSQKSNYYFDDSESVLYSKDKTEFIYYPPSKSGSVFVLEESVKAIENYAFYGNNGLTGIIIRYDGDGFVSRETDSFTGTNTELKIYVDKDKTESYRNEWEMNNIEPNEVVSAGYVLTQQNSGSYDISDYLGEERDLVIESKIIDGDKEYEITGIGDGAFRNNLTVESIVISRGIKNIGTNAFSGCINLKSVDIGETVTGIKSYAFYKCVALEEVVFTGESSLISISSHAFSGCENLTEIEIPYGLQQIGISAFADAFSLKNVIFNEGLVEIGDNAFENCRSIINVSLPSSVTKIGDYVFSGCSRLVYIKFASETAPNIQANAFSGVIDGINYFIPATSIKSYKEDIYWRNYITKILSVEDICAVEKFENYVIKKIIGGYELVTYIGTDEDKDIAIESNISDDIKIISIGEFAIGQFVEKVTLGEGITDIKSRAFYYARAMTEVILPVSLKNIGASAFIGLTKLKSVTISNYADSQLVSIGNQAFYGCTDLKEIILPQALKTIGESAFSTGNDGTMNLESVRFLHDSKKDATSVWLTIGNNAFRNNKKLRTLTFDCYVKSIGEGAFAQCEMLDLIYFNYGQGLTTGYLTTAIVNDAENVFEDCHKLSIVVPSLNVYNTYIRSWRNEFDKMKIIEEKYVKTVEKYDNDGNPYVDYRVVFKIVDANARSVTILNYINGDIEKEEIEIPSVIEANGDTYTVARIGREKDGEPTRINGYVMPSTVKKVVVPTTIRIIGEDAFRNNASLETVEIKESLIVTANNGLQTIEAGAFAGCESLKNITIPATVKAIEESAFAGCTTLDSGFAIKAPVNDNVDLTIGAKAFENCIGLTSFTVPRHVEEIGSYAFSGCTALKTFIFANEAKVSIIGAYAFASTALVEIELPAVVESVGDYAFANCTNLLGVYLHRELSGSVKQLTYTSGNVFYGIENPHVKVYVAESAYTTYAVSDGWKTKTVVKNVISKDGQFAYSVNDAKTAVTITAYRGTDTTLHIPKEISVDNEPIPVTTLAAYFANSLVEKITFEERKSVDEIGLSTIEAYAFSGCTSLKEMHLPDTVTFIDDYAFENCTSLTDLTLPAELTGIEDYVFSNCSALEELTLPNKVFTLGNGAFFNCTSLARLIVKYNISNAVPSVGTGTFRNTGVNAKGGFCIIVPDKIHGTCVSNWIDVSSNIYSDTSLLGDYVLEINLAGTELTLIQYLGEDKELDFTEHTFMGVNVTTIKEGAIKNDTTTIIVNKNTVYPDSMADRVTVKEETEE